MEQEQEKISEERVRKTNPALYFNDTGKFFGRWLAEHILTDYNIITTNDDETIFIYFRGVWEPRGEVFIKREVELRLIDYNSTYRTRETINHIKRMTLAKRSIFDTNPHIIALQNGAFDLKEMQFKEWNPNFYCTTRLPVYYDIQKDCTVIKKFISEIVSAQDALLLQEIIGFCLLKDYRFQIAFIFLGAGANGKSTFLSVLREFLGKENVASVPLQSLDDKFLCSELYNKYANIYADLPQRALKDTGFFKSITGGDMITVQQKFKQPFRLVNYAKLIFSANILPAVPNDSSHAFFRRWIIIQFPFSFDNEVADKSLLEKLRTQEELSGFFNWAVEGLKRLLKNDGFSSAMTLQEAREEYLRNSDTVHAFIVECIDQNVNSEVEKDVLYAEYVAFCRLERRIAFEKNIFAKKLLGAIPIVETRPRNGEVRKYVWKGIKLKNKSHKEQQSCLGGVGGDKSYPKGTKKKDNNGIINEKDPNPQSPNSDVIHLKCSFCDRPESAGWSKTGKPICSYCLENPNLKKHWPEEVVN